MAKNFECPKSKTCLYADDCIELSWIECRYKPVQCPFCFEENFDRAGLKSHLLHGDCQQFNDTEDFERLF